MFKRSAHQGAALGVAAAVLALTGAAHAQSTYGQDPEGPISITVRYGDLDVSHDAGAQMLLRRIQIAAEKACGDRPDYRLLAQRKPFEQCRGAAIHQAVIQMHNPVLTAAARVEPPAIVLASR